MTKTVLKLVSIGQMFLRNLAFKSKETIHLFLLKAKFTYYYRPNWTPLSLLPLLIEKYIMYVLLCFFFFFSDHLPPISEVINGDTKIVTEFKRNEEGKLLKVSVYFS